MGQKGAKPKDAQHDRKQHTWPSESAASKKPERTRSADDVQEQDRFKELCANFKMRYTKCLGEFERAVDSEKESLIRDCLVELKWCNRDAKSIQSGALYRHLQKSASWAKLIAERERIEDKLPCLPMWLTAEPDGHDRLVIRCMNLLGSELAELHASASRDKVMDLRARIRKSVPLPKSASAHATWKLISSSGNVLQKAQDNVAVADALGVTVRCSSG